MDSYNGTYRLFDLPVVNVKQEMCSYYLCWTKKAIMNMNVGPVSVVEPSLIAIWKNLQFGLIVGGKAYQAYLNHHT